MCKQYVHLCMWAYVVFVYTCVCVVATTCLVVRVCVCVCMSFHVSHKRTSIKAYSGQLMKLFQEHKMLSST